MASIKVRSGLLLWTASVLAVVAVLPYVATTQGAQLLQAAKRASLAVSTLFAISVLQAAGMLAIAVSLGSWASRRLGLGSPVIDALSERAPRPEKQDCPPIATGRDKCNPTWQRASRPRCRPPKRRLPPRRRMRLGFQSVPNAAACPPLGSVRELANVLCRPFVLDRFQARTHIGQPKSKKFERERGIEART
jgi:hypothetical protein